MTETNTTSTANPLTTEHEYDGWGIKTSTTLPDGVKTTYSAGWYPYSSSNRRYYSLVQSDGQPWVRTWYDGVGRETSVETVGPKGINISTVNTYNSKGQLTQTGSIQGDITVTETYTYDSRGRLASQSSTGGQNTTYSYGNREQTTTVSTGQYKKTFDAWGNIKSSEDPGNTVSYTWHSSGNPKKINVAGVNYEMQYDDRGNRTSLNEPNTGNFPPQSE